MKIWKIMIIAFPLLVSCQEEDNGIKPDPVELTIEAAGHYCQMTVLEHGGPKAQIHLTGNPHPFWFTQVRDAIAFTLSPEEPGNIAAVYVSDMGNAASWEEPGTNNWIDFDSAWFVIESNQTGGMGAPEAIPFASMETAERFAVNHGGRILKGSEIPEEYVLAPVGL